MADKHGRIPASPREITAEWLTHALRRGGVNGDGAAVKSAAVSELPESSGITAYYALVELDYSCESGSLPKRLFAKGLVPAPGLAYRSFSTHFIQEVTFYTEIAPRTDINVPRYYYGEVDEENGHGILLMEALDPALCGDTLEGISERDLGLTIPELASLHARWWGAGELEALAHLSDLWGSLICKSLVGLYPEVWMRLREALHERISDYVLKFGDALLTRCGETVRRLNLTPKSLIQMDCRAENIAFYGEGEDRHPVLFDWGTCSKGPAIWDLASLMLTGIEGIDDRQVTEAIADYRDRLAQHGAHEYDVGKMEEDFHLAAVCVFVVRAAALHGLQSTNELRPTERMRLAAFTRVAAAIERLGCQEFVSA